MSFEWPAMLATLLLIPMGLAVFVAIERRRRARLGAAGGMGLRSVGSARRGGLAGRLPGILFLGALVLFAIAMARPQAALSLPRPEGIVMLTFDVSGSMAADDLEPSRLDVAAEVAHALVDERPEGVLIGLVAFAEGGLSVQSPSADDVEIRSAIDRLLPTLGTSLGQGVLAALESIERSQTGTRPDYYSTGTPEPTVAPEPVEPGSRTEAVIVLLSDGENTAPPEPIEVAQLAADRGVRIHTVGVGTVDGTILEAEGFSVYTELDEDLLQRVAELTAGSYFPLDPDATEITETFDPDDVYESLGRRLSTRAEPTELTALVAGAGVVLLLAGAAMSLAASGRLV